MQIPAANHLDHWKYCDSLTNYQRRRSVAVNIGDVPLGGDNPIRIQSMTTTNTMNTADSVAQTIRLVEAGCDYIRLTVPSLREAENLQEIKRKLRQQGYHTPLIADIHFTPNAAELAARIVEKVRINPGNYADKKRFNVIEYDDASYQAEIDRIARRFMPLVKICREYGTAMRIGTNHGSLSDRIMSRYGDTPLGMVESALEFLRICQAMNYHQVVLSMKASNTQVMVQAYRLLVQKLNEYEMKPYPLHLGVTEAGNGMDGRIKSAIGTGTLLEDGLGDTIRVSLTEEPEYEVPVAIALRNRYVCRANNCHSLTTLTVAPKNPFKYERRKTTQIKNIGGTNVPRVIADMSKLHMKTINNIKSIGHFYLLELDKWAMNDQAADYVYSGKHKIDFMLPNGLHEIVDLSVWKTLSDRSYVYPLLTWKEFKQKEILHSKLNFLYIRDEELITADINVLGERDNIVLIIYTDNTHAMPAIRRAVFSLIDKDFSLPVVIRRNFTTGDEEKLQLDAAIDIGSLLIDGIGDGVMLTNCNQTVANKLKPKCTLNTIAFGILQAARTRMTKTEYISCPSCGRTLFDLQETTAMIRKRTDHLKGVKIGIMGCIVNGPGEMADADYGYVGSGKGKITLYRGQEIVKKAVSAEHAVNELVELIREDGNWTEPEISE